MTPTVNLEAGAGHWSDPKTFEGNPVEAGAGDLVERLQQPKSLGDFWSGLVEQEMAEAAAQLAAVTAENARLREALEFYAAEDSWVDGRWPDSDEVIEGVICLDEQIEEGGSVLVADCGDRARAVLSQEAPK